MFSIALCMRLKPGMRDAYRKAHDSLWPEIVASMRDNQVSMAIFADADRLFLFATAPDSSCWEKSRAHPKLAAWDAEMTRFLEETSPGRIAFEVPTKLFGFGEFAV